MCDVQADLCYASAFDDTKEPRSDTQSDDDSAMLEMAAADSDSVAEVTHGMTEVASAPSLLMMSAAVDDLPLTEAMSDVSLTAGDDGRPFIGTDGDGKPQLDNALYFYQGQLIISYHHSSDKRDDYQSEFMYCIMFSIFIARSTYSN